MTAPMISNDGRAKEDILWWGANECGVLEKGLS